MAQKQSNGPQFRAPLKWGEGAKNLTGSRHLGCLTTVPIVKRGEEVRIGCWNIRTMNGARKLENVKREMKRYGLGVLGLSETHWKDQRDYLSDDIRIISSGGEDRARGVAVLLDKEWARRVTVVEQKSDRLMMIKLKNEPTDIVIVQVYMPTSACEDVEIEKMYEQIEDIVDQQKGTDYVIAMGDWNAVVGEGREGNEFGPFGLGTRNERGERLIKFCK